MMKNRTLQLSAAAAIVALAGTAQAAKYIPVFNALDNPMGVDATDGYTAAEKLDLAQTASAQAGWYEATVSSSVVYGNPNVSMNDIRVTVPVLLWENDSIFNAPVVQVLDNGDVFGAVSLFGDFVPTADFLFSGRKGAIIGFSNAAGANANNVFVDESFVGGEIGLGEDVTRSNTIGSITPSGIVMWRANFAGGSDQNNIEYIDAVGTRAGGDAVQIGGSLVPPAQTTLGLPGEVPSAGSGAKVFAAANGVDTAGGSFTGTVPTAVTTTAGLILNFYGHGWDRDFANTNQNPNPAGHHVYTRSTFSAVQGQSDTPRWSWPTADPTDDGAGGDGVQFVPVLPGSDLAGGRRGSAQLVKINDLDSAMHIMFSISASGRGSGDSAELIVIDRLDFAATNPTDEDPDTFGNGYTNGAYFLPANPNYTPQFLVPDFSNNEPGDTMNFVDPYAALFTPNGTNAPGVDGDYRFAASRDTAGGGGGFAPPVYDINADGDIAVIWEDATGADNGAISGNPFDDQIVFEVRLYEAVVGPDNNADEYLAPVTIARSGDGTSYDDGFTFDQARFIGCDGDSNEPFASNPLPFSGVALDDDGNVAFTANSEIFFATLTDADNDDPMSNGLPDFASCFGDETPGNGDTVDIVDGSTASLFFYVRDEATLLRTVDSGINGLEIAASAGAPNDWAISLGRFRNDNDSDAFNANALSETGRVAAVAFRPGGFDRDANNDGILNDPAGVFLDNGLEETDGLLLDRNASGGFENQVISAVRGVAVIELGEITIEDPKPVTLCTADLEGDFDVDLDDFSIFAAQFGSSGMGLTADIDGDMDVDLDDFSIFAAQFGNGPAACDPGFGG